MTLGKTLHRRIRSRILHTLCTQLNDKKHLSSQTLRNMIWFYLIGVTGDRVRSIKETLIRIWI
jgi:hypothetical protein